MSTFRCIYKRKGHSLVEHVKTALKNLKHRRRYAQPPPETDSLYKSDFVHPYDLAEPCAAVCGDDDQNLITRGENDEEDDDPLIYYGLTAVHNQLRNDACMRDTLPNSKDVPCFETEASGLMNHFHCLVVRGICNYPDSHANKEWQGFAAMITAAYAKDLGSF